VIFKDVKFIEMYTAHLPAGSIARITFWLYY